MKYRITFVRLNAKTSEAETIISAMNQVEVEKKFYEYFSKKRFIIIRTTALPVAYNEKKDTNGK